MKRTIFVSASCWLLGLITALGQPGFGGGPMGGSSSGVGLSGSAVRLFGENSAFSANVEIEAKGGAAGESLLMPGKMAFDKGKSRFDMDLSQLKSEKMPPGAADQMKAMGMDKMSMISRPDKKQSYMVYPNLKAYVEMPLADREAQAATAEDWKLETTELGKETVDGHSCIKSKAIVTDKDGKKYEATVWNATDLKKFPVRMQMSEQGTLITMTYKNVKLAKPDSGEFDPPSGLTKYNSMPEMMQQVMMKRFNPGAGGFQPPPGQ
jgi:hypothetical protein